jgi:hypothetical protein
LTLIHGKGDPDSPFVQYELEDIKEACALEAQLADVTYWELFYPKNIYRTHIGMFTQIWSQLTGMNVMMYCKYRLQFSIDLKNRLLTAIRQTSPTSSAWQATLVTPTCSPPQSNTSST